MQARGPKSKTAPGFNKHNISPCKAFGRTGGYFVCDSVRHSQKAPRLLKILFLKADYLAADA